MAAAMNAPKITFNTGAENLKPDRRSCLHETADGYASTLVGSGRWRVIRCRDDLQFIVQKRAGRAKARPWQAVAYILNVSAFGPVLRRPGLGIPADDLARLLAGLTVKDGGPRHD